MLQDSLIKFYPSGNTDRLTAEWGGPLSHQAGSLLGTDVMYAQYMMEGKNGPICVLRECTTPNRLDWLYPLMRKPFFIYLECDVDTNVEAWYRLTPWMFVSNLIRTHFAAYASLTVEVINRLKGIKLVTRGKDWCGDPKDAQLIEEVHHHKMAIVTGFSKCFTKLVYAPVRDVKTGKWYSLLPDVSLSPEEWRSKCAQMSVSEILAELGQKWTSMLLSEELVWHAFHDDYYLEPSGFKAWESLPYELNETLMRHSVHCEKCGEVPFQLLDARLDAGTLYLAYGSVSGDPFPLCGSEALKGPFEFKLATGVLLYTSTFEGKAWTKALHDIAFSDAYSRRAGVGYAEGRRLSTFLHHGIGVMKGSVSDASDVAIYRLKDTLLLVDGATPLPDSVYFVGSVSGSYGSFLLADLSVWNRYADSPLTVKKSKKHAADVRGSDDYGYVNLPEGSYVYDYLIDYDSHTAWERLPEHVRTVLPFDDKVKWYGVISPTK